MAQVKFTANLKWISHVINVSELPPSCYTDGSLCGDFLTERCPLREVVLIADH